MELRSYLFGTVAYVRDNKYSTNAIAAALLCKLTPEQLNEKIKNSDDHGRMNIETFVSNYTTRGRPSKQWNDYLGSLMAEVFRVSGYPNYQLFINQMGVSKHYDVVSLLKIYSVHVDSEYYHANFLPPKFLYLIDKYMREHFSDSWHERWTNQVYVELNKEPNKEKFAEFKSLGKDFGSASGLEICPSQSFGIEIEITTNRTFKIPNYNDDVWLVVAGQILQTLNSAVGVGNVYQHPTNYHELQDYSLWKVEYDQSVGWEVVSPILYGFDGAMQIKNVFEALNFLISEHDFLTVDYKCGLHLNIGTHITSNSEWQSFIKRYIRIEPGLLPLVSPSRVLGYNKLLHTYSTNKSNTFCTPVSFDDEYIKEVLFTNIERKFDETDKFRAIKFKKISKKGSRVNLLEVRLHNGTTSYLAVLSWLALWMKIVNYFESGDDSTSVEIKGHDFKNCSDENVIDLIKILNSQDTQRINSKLKKVISLRRQKMKVNWMAAFPEKVESWTRAGFYDEPEF